MELFIWSLLLFQFRKSDKYINIFGKHIVFDLMREIKNDLVVKVLTAHIKANSKLYKCFNHSHNRQIYKLSEYLTEILYVLKTGISWRNIRSHIYWNSIYKAYIKLNKYKIFESCYKKILLTKYLKKGANKKLRFIITDTTFIPNKNGNNKVGYNKYYNKKNGTKISIICDSKGIPIDTAFYKGNINDSKILLDHLNNSIINKLSIRCHFMADKGYHTKEIINTLNERGFIPLIAQNKRNIKNENLINKMNDDDKEIYKNRSIIERLNAKIKNNKKLQLRYEKDICNYEGLYYLFCIKNLC